LKYAIHTGIVCACLLIIFCFLPWAFYPDLQENFNGFYSKQNTYGKPGITFIFLSGITIVLFLIRKIWARRLNQFISVLIFAYALKTFILFTSSYGGIHPEVKPGLIGIPVLAMIILISGLLSGGIIEHKS
jgi:peptidoglycan/LPS O-acetylase OafA/YrhL